MLIDFEGLVDVVDSIGGVTINVEQRIEEQGIARDQSELIVIEKGEQKLNGNEALAFLRHRKTLANGVYGRSNNQELFILAMIQQLARPSSWFRISGFMSTIQKSVLTNLSGSSIVTYYNDASIILSKNGLDSLLPERLELEASGAMIYTPSFGGELFYSILKDDSLRIVKDKFQLINTVE